MNKMGTSQSTNGTDIEAGTSTEEVCNKIKCVQCGTYFKPFNEYRKRCDDCVKILGRTVFPPGAYEPYTPAYTAYMSYEPSYDASYAPKLREILEAFQPSIQLKDDEIIPGYSILVMYKVKYTRNDIENKYDSDEETTTIKEIHTTKIIPVEYPLPKALTRDDFDDNNEVLNPESITINGEAYFQKDTKGCYDEDNEYIYVFIEIDSAKLIKKSLIPLRQKVFSVSD